MTAVLPANLNEDTIPVFLRKQLGIPFSGDAELQLLAGAPLPVIHQISAAAVTTAATTTSLSASDTTSLTTALTKRKASKV